MSPKPLDEKAARPGRSERGHPSGETPHTTLPSVPQPRNYIEDNTLSANSPQKRSAPLDDKGPGRKRHRTDPLPQHPSPPPSILKTNLGPLKEEIRTLRKDPGHPQYENAPVRKVKENVYLDDGQVTLAIAAVTEVVNWSYNPEMYLWSLLSSTTLVAARKHPPLDRSECPRLIRSKLVFPMFLTPKNLLSYPDVVKDGKDKAAIYASDQEHIFLVKVLFNRGKSRLPQLVILDSSPSFVDRSSDEWKLAISEMTRIVTNLGVFDPPTRTVALLPPLESCQIVFEPAMEIQVARQQNSWACGVHTIMNAWADALLFRPNPACKMSRDSCKHAVDVINLVLEGRATLNLVVHLLVSTDFVLHTNRKQGQAITEMRQQSKPFREYHRINSTADLDLLIMSHELEATNRLKPLIQENLPDSALASCVAKQTVLPRLRRVALQQQVEAAKKAADVRLKEVNKGQLKEEQELHIGEATVVHFKDKVQRSGSAKAKMDEFCQALMLKDWISDPDNSNVVGVHKPKEYTLQEGKDVFIRLLGYHTGFATTEYWWRWADSELLQLYFKVWFDDRKAEDPAKPARPNTPK
ncbi:hypothetical protein E2P81_ATG03085 [Venturia nashicola]|nr:hypothetical protein E2P81_ATG03085 [Venturia nashicola]